MSSILTNSKVGANMSDLELRARSGDPWAQAQLEREAAAFGKLIQADQKMGMDLQERSKLLKK